jgi:hypothetical protein
MSLDIQLLTSLAECQDGRGLMLNSPRLKKAAKQLINKGWADAMECGGLYVCIITSAGRAALAVSSPERQP